MDPNDYHLSKNGLDSFKKLLGSNRIHSYWPGMECGFLEENVEDEEDEELHELEYTNGSNEVVNILNQKCVVCLERDSDYLLKHCGHQSFCEECFKK